MLPCYPIQDVLTNAVQIASTAVQPVLEPWLVKREYEEHRESDDGARNRTRTTCEIRVAPVDTNRVKKE